VSVKPVTVSVAVPQGPQAVFDFLDVLANHEQFTDHFLVDWETSGPRQGVGARARMRVRKPGPDDWLEMEVISAERPRRSAEQSTSAQGRRVTRGTYELEKADDGGTSISFELAWLQAPTGERLIGPITRAVTRRANAKALRRLAELLAAKGGREPGRERS
jgi:Polyketide cyclase / dehydrase and lipid transport